MDSSSVIFIALILLLLFSFPTDARQLTSTEWQKLQENYILPNSEILLHFGIFLFFALIFIFPPDAVVGMGLTLENWAGAYLGVPDPDIVQYQCRRIVVNRCFVATFPFLFSVYLFLSEEHALIFASQPTRAIHYFANFSVLALAGAVLYMAYHHLTDFRYLSGMQVLSRYNTEIKQLLTNIASECLLLETFKYNISSSSRLIVTNNWMIYYTKFSFTVLKVDDIKFRVTDAEEFALIPYSTEGAVQLISLVVEVPANLGTTIKLKVNNLTLRDLQNKLNHPIEIAPNVTLKYSTNERFAKVFAAEARKNPRYLYTATNELEKCLGCSETLANVKLVKACENVQREDETQTQQLCQHCYCRPMWCVWCMGRIFAAKQDQDRTETWLGGKAPCPTCRAPFCIFDVALITNGEETITDDELSNDN